MNRIVLVALMSGALVVQAAERQLATVLPFDASRAKLERDQRTILEEAIRTAAGDALSPAGITVLTSETQLKLLEDNGIDTLKCADATCHLDTAREMKATYFISGVIAKEDDDLVAFIRMFDTLSGRQLASVQVEGKTPKELRKAFGAQSAEFFRRAGFGADEREKKGPGGSGFLTVLANPAADVLVDGVLVGPSPVRRRVIDAGAHTVTLRASGYPTLSKSIGIEPGKELVVDEKLQKSQGFLEIKVVPADAKVFVDGLLAGAGRQGPFAIGQRVVRAEATGFRASELTVELKDGASLPLAIALDPMPARVVVTTNVEAQCEVAGASFKTAPGAAAEQVIAVGPQTLVCRSRGFLDATQAFNAIAGEAFPVALVLEKRTLPPAGTVLTEERAGYAFVSIPGGEFSLGCVKGDTKCFRDEKPAKKVIVQPLLLGKTEVTVGAYERCVDAGACRPPSDAAPTCTWGRRADLPVNCVDAAQASTFCKWIGGRLPSAIEWEFAAKSGKDVRYPWGNERPGAFSANYCDTNCVEAAPEADDYADPEFDDGHAAAAPVGSYPRGASEWGLVDMSGNVWEWTATAYDARRAEIRGGSWLNMIGLLRTSVRSQQEPKRRSGTIGFRCAQ